MTLRAAIKSRLDSRFVLGGLAGLPERPRLLEVEQAVTERFGIGKPPEPPPDMEEIARDVRGALLAGAPDRLAGRQLRYAPLCIWEVEAPLADERALLVRLLDHIARLAKRSLIRTLAAVYFRAFEEGRPGLDLVGLALKAMAGPEIKALSSFQRMYDVFDPTEGPGRVAEACLRQDMLPQGLLRHHGLSGLALTGGFGAACYRAGMMRFRETMERKPQLDIVRAVAAWTDEGGETPYRDADRTLAETLLLPFKAQDATDDLRHDILDVVLGRIGDPRTKPQKWVRMEAAAEVARRWLTRLALRQFLEIVDETAYQNHWEYRKRFWMAFYRKAAVAEAWVAFGPEGEVRARQLFGKTASFGRLHATQKQVQRGHAILLLRIGDYTVVDWSHDGRCIIWPTSSSDAPPLYRYTYMSGDLAPREAPKGGFEVSHQGSQNYWWQRKIAGFIREKTGISLADRDFMVT